MNINNLIYLVLLILYNCLFLPKIFANTCYCPNQQSQHNIYDVSLNTNYSTEWWYILINYLDIESPIVSQEIIWLRHGKTCNGSSIYFYQESVLYRNSSLINHLEFQIQTDHIQNPFLQVNNHSLHFSRNLSYNLKHHGINNNLTMNGFGYPQGYNRDGFVRTGEYNCDTSYTLSFPNLKVETGDKYQGIAYGEHVLTSTDKSQSPYLGWNCHYFHSLIPKSNLSSYFVCQSKFPNPKQSDPYQRALLLFSDNSTYWTKNFTLNSLHNWTSSTSNITYPIYWKITIEDIVQHYFIPYYQNGEIDFHHFPIHLWDSSTAIFDHYNRLIGIGFNEIFLKF
jgi:hypothetical protein